MIRKVVLFHLLMVLILLLAGCWDEIEIEDRGFIIGSGIDVAEDDQGKKELTLTHQFVTPEGIGTPTEGGGDEPAFDNLTATGPNMFEISRKMAEQTSKVPFYEHEQVIIISSNVAKQPYLFGKVMDIFMRNPEMRRSIKVAVADGEANKVLNTKPDSEKVPIIYLDSIMENSFTNASEMEPVRIGMVHEDLLDNMSYVLPRIITEEKSVKSKGAAVFKGYNNQMVGVLDSLETKGLNLITGKAVEGVIKTDINRKDIVYELEDISSNIKLDASDPRHMNVHVTINASGSITESFGTENLFEEGSMEEIEKQVSSEMEKVAGQTIEKAQTELETDVFGIGKQLKERHYGKWQQLKDNWDRGANYFSDVTFHVDVSANVKDTGNVNKTNR